MCSMYTKRTSQRTIAEKQRRRLGKAGPAWTCLGFVLAVRRRVLGDRPITEFQYRPVLPSASLTRGYVADAPQFSSTYACPPQAMTISSQHACARRLLPENGHAAREVRSALLAATGLPLATLQSRGGVGRGSPDICDGSWADGPCTGQRASCACVLPARQCSPAQPHR